MEIMLNNLVDFVVSVRPCNGGQQILVKFPNNYGASIVRHQYSHGSDQGLFELAVIHWSGEDWDISYNTPIASDVLGWLTPNMVRNVLHDIKAL